MARGPRKGKWILILAVLLVGCQAVLPSPTPSPIPPTPTRPLPTAPPPTPTPAPLGSAQNPFLVGLVPNQTASQAGSAGRLGEMITEQSGLDVQVNAFPDYPSLLEAMDQGKIQAGWLPPLTYLLAYSKAIAQVGLVANHYGVYGYGTQFLVNAASGFTIYFDPAKNASTAGAADALRQFAGKTPCWVDPTSASGYIVPLGLLTTRSIQTQPGVITQDHTAVIRALYAGGICDFGATFGVIGDPRTASAIEKDLPDVMQKVIVAWQTPPVIPNLNLSYAWQIPESTRSSISEALISLAQNQAGQAVLTGATGYQIDGLKMVDQTFYSDLQTYVKNSGVDLNSLIGK